MRAAIMGGAGVVDEQSQPRGGRRGHRSRLGVAAWATPLPRFVAMPATPWLRSGQRRHPKPYGWLARPLPGHKVAGAATDLGWGGR
jgi:hypothetical protein